MAFSAVSSVARILDQTLQHQRLILENRQQVESLFEQVKSLQAMLQKKSEIIISLESQIIHGADKARRLIESHVAEQIIRSNNLIFSSHESLDEAKTELHVVYQQLKKIDHDDDDDDDWEINEGGLDDDGGAEYALELCNSKVDSDDNDDWEINDQVGVDDDARQIRNLLLGYDEGGLATISIVGMPGIGKTMCAEKVFNDSLISSHFHLRGWVTISKFYDMRQILIDLLHSLNDFFESVYDDTIQELQERLYKLLEHKRYLIVLDDVCDTQVLENLSRIFVDDRNGSRILVTTRLDNLGDLYTKSYLPHRMTVPKQNLRLQRLIQNGSKEAESLLLEVSRLHDKLKNSSPKRKSSLENQIINAEKIVKDFIKSCVIEYEVSVPLMEVKEEIDLIKQLIIRIENVVQRSSFKPPASNTNRTVGLDRDLAEIKNKLAEQSSKLQIVSLVGMGGLGKTTLAKQIYNDELTVQNFHVSAWVTISQSYDLQRVVVSLLDSLDNHVRPKTKERIEDSRLRLYQKLKERKYLIVLDDVWDTQFLQDLMKLFPDDNCSSRILLTTRLAEVAVNVNSCLHHVHFLDADASWNLFCNKVFGEGGSCPSHLETIGKNIVQHCQGLPLAIVVAGGILSKAKTQDYWGNVVENLDSLLFSNEDDHFSKMLSLSYTHLPHHLKKCFLYTGTFLGGGDISASKLVKLWIAEGFLEQRNSNKLMEDIAYEYLSDLAGRSLVLVHKHGSTGKVKTCSVHDLVRDFCMQEAKAEMLLHMTDISLYGVPARPSVPLLLSIHPNPTNIFPFNDRKLSALGVSSLHIADPDFLPSLHQLNLGPVGVLDMAETVDSISQWEVQKFLTCSSRYLSCYLKKEHRLSMSSSSILPNLQTLILRKTSDLDVTKFPTIIWNMTQLRHVKVSSLRLSEPVWHRPPPRHNTQLYLSPSQNWVKNSFSPPHTEISSSANAVEGENSVDILENLQTLSHVYNFRWSKEVLRRIQNLKKLGIIYRLDESEWHRYCLENLMCLQKLEALTCTLFKACPSFLHILTFPPSLRKLTLEGCHLPWKDMKIVGSLPNLEVLKLRVYSFECKDWEWESTDGEFPKLKYLLLENLHLKLWTADSVNFPSLQHLIIRHCKYLEQIPRCIGEIPTLELIELVGCDESLIELVKEIEKEQLESGYTE